MSNIEWTAEGVEIANCNCDYGCPCQFNGDPTHGDCRAYVFVQIDRGRFGDVKLDGLRFGALFTWPGAIHEGNGTSLSIIDESASPQQREALEAISQGRETDPGCLVWQIFASTVTDVRPSLVRPIDLKIDVDARRASVRVPEVVEGDIEPIANEMYEDAHRVRVVLPNGFEFTEAEFASGRGRDSADFNLEFDGTHAHLARVHWSTHGVIR